MSMLVPVLGAVALLACAAPAPAATILSAASYDPVLAPGSIAVVFGANMAAEPLLAGGAWPTELGGVSVAFNGIPARIQFVSPGQLNILVPPQLAEGEAEVVIRNRAGVNATERVTVRLCAPGVFALDAQGRGAIVNGVTAALDPFSTTTPENPGADKRTVLSIYGTGIRYAGNAARDDARNVAAEVRVQVYPRNGSSRSLPVVYAGAAPGFTGLDQVNVFLPEEIENIGEAKLVLFAAGESSKPVNLIFAAASAPSPAEVSPQASPGERFTITGADLPVESPLDSRTRLGVVVRAAGVEAQAWVAQSAPELITAVMPAIPAPTGWYQGPAEVCVSLGEARSCLSQKIEVTAVPPTPEAGATLLGLAREAREGAASALAEAGVSAPGFAAHAAVLESKLNGVIQDAVSGRPQSRSVAMADGSRQNVVLDTAAVRQVESLIAAQSRSGTPAGTSDDTPCSYPEESAKMAAKMAHSRLQLEAMEAFARAAAAAVTGAAAACSSGGSGACSPALATAILALEAGWLPAGWSALGGQLDLQRTGNNVLLRLLDPTAVRVPAGAAQEFTLQGAFGNLTLKDAAGQPLETTLSALSANFTGAPFARLAAQSEGADARRFLQALQQYTVQKFYEEWRPGLLELARGAPAAVGPAVAPLSARSIEHLVGTAGPLSVELACRGGLALSRVTAPAGAGGTVLAAFVPGSSLLWREEGREFMARLRVDYGAAAAAGVVRGVVRNAATSQAIAGATVEIAALSLNAAADGAGAYTLNGVPAGSYTLQARAEGFASAETPINVAAGQTLTRDFALTPAGRGVVQGKVINGASGRPVAGARVEILALGLNAASDQAGAYQIAAVPAGTHTVRAGAAGFVTTEAAVQVEAGGAVTRDFALAPTSPPQGTLVTGPHNIQFVAIAAGEFSMGCSLDDYACPANEKPAHLARVSRAFEIGRYEVTQSQWETIMGANPSRVRNPNHPVDSVSWDEVQIFFERLNTLNDGYFYRLPTEAEWEYAARAGSTTARYGLLDDVAWHQGNSGGQPHPVGQKQPNAWGLYDTLGNVAERVRDWLGPYTLGLSIDPAGPASGTQRIERGGGWSSAAQTVRASNRDVTADPASGFNHLGFRCVRERIKAIPEGLHTIQFVSVAAGEFRMGCSPSDLECGENEWPAHTVRITRPYEVGRHEVTQLQWDWMMGSNPSQFQRADRPVENVTWHEVQKFLERLNSRADGYHYRLPTEAEWEYAARAGGVVARYGGLDEIAWYQGNSGGVTHPPGEKRPNAWDLFDTLGGVWEWVQDSYGNYGSEVQVDPKGPSTGAFPVVRGGAWDSPATTLRVSARENRDPGLRFPNTGFRCVREVLPVARIPELHSLTLSALSIPSGGSATGTVRLTFPALPGGTSVALSSSNPAVASVPVDVMVPAGRTSADFPVTARPVSTQQTLTITARLAAITKTAPLTVNAPVVLFRMEFVTVPPGEFTMGCSPGDSACDADESPAHTVRISRAFELGKYEVQQGQWEGVLGANPAFFLGPERPVEQVSFFDVQFFLQRLNARGDSYRYRLPSEAEWEYAARAGAVGPRYGNLDSIAWHAENSGGQTHVSGGKEPNAFGLYDMYGNVWEYVQDWYGPYASGAAVDPKGPADGFVRVMRGGSWTFEVNSLRASDRSRFPEDEKSNFIGFRLVRERR